MNTSITFGMHAVTSLLKRSPERIVRLLVQDNRDDKRLNELLALARERKVQVAYAPRKQLNQITEGVHQGVIAECKALKAGNEDALTSLLESLQSEDQAPLLLVLDGVTDPHNLGACLRSADAAGAVAVIAPKDKSAPLNATAQKVACGAAEVVPYIQVTNLARTLELLKSYGIWVTGTAGEATDEIYDVDLKGPQALVMGAEGKGMRRLTREHCDQLVKLPMAGEVSSLNVSVACGICLFEVVRQRR